MKLSILIATSMLSMATAAFAGATCESVRTDLTGTNVFGTHTIMQLSQATRAGDCDAAAFLSRRARDAQGFLETHCPAETNLRETAAAMLKLGQDTLHTPACED